MAQALYRKYRPTTFAAVVNQEHIKTVLENEVKSGHISHAYLFAGPRGVGKTTLARIFAKAINAEAIARQHLSESTLLDIIEIDAASHTGVDHVRENIIQNAMVAPAQLQYKVFIIDEVHMLSASSFNALLKILEEPPAHVVFILATTEVHKLPATVISRCQRFDFHAIALAEIVKRLQYLCVQEQVQVDTPVLERVARKAGGAIRDAESMLGQLLALREQHITEELADMILPKVDMTLVIELFEHLLQRQPAAYIQSLQVAVTSGMHMKELYALLVECIRQALLYSLDHQLEHIAALDVHENTHQRLLQDMQQLRPVDGLRLLDIFLGAAEYFVAAPLPQLPLELAGIMWCEQGQATTQAAVAAGGTTPSALPAATIKKFSPPAVSPIPATHVPAPSARTPDPQLLETIQQQWLEIIRRTKAANQALAMALSVGHLAGAYQPNIIVLGFRYDFHRDRVTQLEHLEIVRGTISEIAGCNIIIECVVGPQYDIDLAVLNTLPSDNIAAVNPPEVGNIWDLALSTLDGTELKRIKAPV